LNPSRSIAAYLRRAGLGVSSDPARLYLEVDNAVAAFRALGSGAVHAQP